jgi:uncharacterized membrane protein YkoI
MKISDELNNKAINIALEKLKIKSTETRPNIVKTSIHWNTKLLRQISETNVRTHKGNISIKHDIDTGELLGWRYNDIKLSSHKIAISKEEALDIAKKEITVPSDAILDSYELINRGGIGYVYAVKWKHNINNIEVDDDYIIVKINPETKEVISVTKNWSEINE